jgi:hypothetical protein
MRNLIVLALAVGGAAACSGPSTASNGRATPLYNKDTGRLEQLVSDRNGDGKIDTRALMDGVRFKSIEIDRNGDGQPDRWEYYETTAENLSVLARAEEANGPTRTVTRKEFYEKGKISRVEEDTNFDGRLDKWEFYQDGGLARLELDLQGKGFPDRRIYYGKAGTVEKLEVDPDGDGKFEPAPLPDAGRKGGE